VAQADPQELEARGDGCATKRLRRVAREGGIAGEELVGAELERQLASFGVVVLHSIKFLRYGDIDHIVVGRGGITVVDAKNWAGAVCVRDRVPYARGRSQRKEVEKLDRQCLAVRLALLHARPDLRGTDIHGVMCFAQEPQRRPEPVRGRSVLCGSTNAAEIAAHHGPLSEDDIDHLRDTLTSQLSTDSPLRHRRAHGAHCRFDASNRGTNPSARAATTSAADDGAAV
jgi:hypothetical protein